MDTAPFPLWDLEISTRQALLGQVTNPKQRSLVQLLTTPSPPPPHTHTLGSDVPFLTLADPQGH